ncbi:unnamed protein product [Plutella xylostella]|uniref:(diamondback moth) hypothetical protein n=1 Tax=Plutella xylostella TaxID=51655 RepID=A0A8S4DAC6_PLUXY|nr:unnamed protein product [Plutella xylostella]
MQQATTEVYTTGNYESPVPLDEALSKPDDEELFYTASLHFLRRRLEDRSSEQHRSTQSCCNLSTTTSSPKLQPAARGFEYPGVLTEWPLLPMNQVLPFPKCSNMSFFNRLKKTFRIFRRSGDITMSSRDLPADSTSLQASHFKFPRCERPRTTHRKSDLERIGEEKSDETRSEANYLHHSSSKGDFMGKSCSLSEVI